MGAYKDSARQQRISLRGGITVSTNGTCTPCAAALTADFVYLAPPWAVGIGEPYVIARVMEILPQGAPARGGSAGPGTQIRANLFFRMRELVQRANNDSRLLVATMHTETLGIEALRGKCRVMHRELIGSSPEVAAWKRRDDHFYYYQLYDRYIHRFYDVIPTYRLRNAPDAVLTTLRDRYSFVVAEVGISADLCDALRGCAICRQWAASAESVRCDTCRKFFHMSCLNPPLASKPAKGYSWTCAPCAKEHDDIVDEHGVGGGGLDAQPGSGPVHGPRSAAQTTPKRTNRASMLGDVPEPENALLKRSAQDRQGLRCFHGWPYRYFGEHTKALDVLDPYDLIYPRAMTRTGPKYQVEVPSWSEQLALGRGQRAEDPAPREEPKARTKRRGTSGATAAKRRRTSNTPDESTPQPDISDDAGAQSASPAAEEMVPRGEDENLEVIFAPPAGTDMDAVEEYLRTVSAPQCTAPRYNVDFLDRALELLCAAGMDEGQARHAMAHTRDTDVHMFHLSAKETCEFDRAMREHDAEMPQLKRALPERPYPEIVRHLYAWKTQRLGEQWHEQRQGRTGADSARRAAAAQRPASPALSLASDDEEMPDEAEKRTVRTCAFCSTTASPFWYKGLWVWTNPVLCPFCGQHWRKYAAETSSVTITDAKRRQAIEFGSEEAGLGAISPVPDPAAAARQVVSSAPQTSTATTATATTTAAAPTTTARSEHGRCVLCRRLDPKKSLLTCANCSLIVHRGCAAADGNAGRSTDGSAPSDWLCDVCANERDPEVALIPHCVLCKEAARRNTPSQDGSVPLTALDVYKPTEYNGWAHLVCAVWTPDIVFGDASTLRPVEGAGNLPPGRYSAPCSLCNKTQGACVTCAEPTCRTRFHVACAFQAQPSYTFAFEIFPVKTSRRDSVATLSFKSETGHMCAQVWCKEHRHVAKSKTVYDLGEMDSKLGLTALQAFAATHKQAASTSQRNTALVESTHALLRRARRLDAVLQSCGGAGAFVRDNTLLPMTGADADGVHPAKPEEEAAKLKAEADAPAHACLRCHTTFTPLWWPVPHSNELCCTRCRPEVLGGEAAGTGNGATIA